MRNQLICLCGCLILMITLQAQSTNEKNYDTRWFISPMMKGQVQEFGMLEINRKNELSDANTLKIQDKVNASLAASVYKNFSGHFSMSLDLGFSHGHVTSKDVLISSTLAKTYNVANATLYYHLLGGKYRLQPFIAAGINHITNDASYTSAPVGAGVKFTNKWIMLQAQAAYGYSVSANIANTLMYSAGIYFPFKSKKSKKKEEEKKSEKDSTKTEGTTTITNNYYFFMTPGADSLKDQEEKNIQRKKAAKKTSAEEEDDILGLESSPAGSGNTTDGDEEEGADDSDGTENKLPLDPDDPMNLPSAVKHTVYFYYDQYSLTSSAFGIIDQIIQRMKQNRSLQVHLKGYTDLSGSEQYNLPLSKKRAQMVFDYMNSRGIPSDRMILSHYGKENPVVNSDDPKSAWQNRRCEIVLSEKK